MGKLHWTNTCSKLTINSVAFIHLVHIQNFSNKSTFRNVSFSENLWTYLMDGPWCLYTPFQFCCCWLWTDISTLKKTDKKRNRVLSNCSNQGGLYQKEKELYLRSIFFFLYHHLTKSIYLPNESSSCQIGACSYFYQIHC